MERIQLEDFTQFKFLSDIEHAPKGKVACFVLHECDVEENKYRSNLWLRRENQQLALLTTLQEERNFTWRQDGERILFSSMRNSKDKEKAKNGEIFTQFYEININGGEAKKAFRINKRVTSIHEINENTFLITAIFDPYIKDLEDLDELGKQKELKRRNEEKDYEVLEEIPFWTNGGSFTNKMRNRLYLYDVKENKLEAITDESMIVQGISLKEDAKKAIFIGKDFKGKMELESDLYLYDIEAKKIEKIDFLPTQVHGRAYFMEDKIIYVGREKGKYGLNENTKIYLANLNEKTVTCLTPDLDYSINSSVGSDCRYGGGDLVKLEGEYLYFVTTEGEYSILNRINQEGIIEKLSDMTGSVDSFSIKDDEILFIGLRGQKLQELYQLDNRVEKQISYFNEEFIKNKSIVKPEKLTVETDKGIMIDGWVMKPVDFDSNKKYPAILNIHGGPKTVYSDIYYHEMQYWANEGYVVFFCNPRGSDGKGNAFADIRGKYGTIDYDDIMKFTDTVIEKYDCIDTDRIGVTGGSYGGFMTNWIIGHTHRFKAAVSQRSISNWISFFGTTDIGYYFADDQISATPWDTHDKLWEHSPLKYANQVKTPTLFIHSEADYRCWVVEGMQMFTALKYHGVTSRMCMFREENHELSRSGKPKHRIRRLEEITNWFNQYLKAE